MSDLIKREDAIKAIDDKVNGSDNRLWLREIISDLPSADLNSEFSEWSRHWFKDSADRPSGEWIYGTDEDGNEDAYPWTCSICGEKYPWHPNYCPHCGARMKDVTEGLESRTDLIWYGDKTDLIGDETGRHTGWFGKGADDE